MPGAGKLETPWAGLTAKERPYVDEWLSLADPADRAAKTLKLTRREFSMLNYLAGTEAGEDATSIVVDAVRDKMEAMFKERGFVVERDENGMLNVVGKRKLG